MTSVFGAAVELKASSLRPEVYSLELPGTLPYLELQ